MANTPAINPNAPLNANQGDAQGNAIEARLDAAFAKIREEAATSSIKKGERQLDDTKARDITSIFNTVARPHQ